MKYLEILLGILYIGVIFGSVAALIFALVADFMGWYEPDGRYRGPFSKRG